MRGAARLPNALADVRSSSSAGALLGLSLQEVRPGPPDLFQCGDDPRAKLGSGVGADLREGRKGRPGGPVGAGAGEGVECVGDENDSCGERDLVAAEAVGIPGTVDPFVAGASTLADERMQVELGEDVVRDHRVRLDHVPLGVVEGAFLAQDLLRYADLADVVEEGSELDCLE